MNYCQVIKADTANGIGFRLSLFVSGCRNHCKGCFQPRTWDFNYGQSFTKSVADELIKELSKTFYDGLTILGGEVFEPENQPVILQFLRQIKAKLPQKTIWLYSGYVYEKDLKIGGAKFIPNVTDQILALADILVDGPFVLSKLDVSLNYRGSSNQRIIDLKESARQGETVLSPLNN